MQLYYNITRVLDYIEKVDPGLAKMFRQDLSVFGKHSLSKSKNIKLYYEFMAIYELANNFYYIIIINKNNNAI